MTPLAAARSQMSGTELGERVRNAVKNRANLDGMRRSFRTITDRQKENSARIPDLEDRKDRLRKTKESSVGRQELLAQALASLRENGFRVVLLKSAESARKQILQELDDRKLVVKSKSNVTKELHLAEFLEGEGVEVIETDLGDRIIQLAGCPAVHPTGPACHMTRGQISELFTRHFGRKVSEDPAELTRVMRDEIAGYLAKAQVGITGANAISASEGAVIIVHNEGNATRCSMAPDKHIIVTTPDKIVPTLDDAVNVTKLQTYLSTGKIVSSYINIITGPSYTADIEKKVYKGMHGPREVVILLVDDGRLKAADKEPQYCIGCGMCLLHCPVYNVVGPLFGPSGHMGGQGVYLEGTRGRLSEAVDSGLYLCTTCGGCTSVCPARIDTKKGIINVRTASYKSRKGLTPEHQAVLSSVRNYDNPWQTPRRQKAKWAEGLAKKGDVLYFAGCSTSLLFPENAQRSVRLMRLAGADPAYLGEAERCCGSTARKIGDETLARQKLEGCISDFVRADARLVVTSCPGCASALNRDPDLLKKNGMKVEHMAQFLAARIDSLNLKRIKGMANITFHDPCDLGRELGVFDEPRRLLSAVAGASFVDMERSNSTSACCGSGSGVGSAYPELAQSVALDRLRMAKDVEAEVIVTACPWCLQSLREAAETESGMRVIDITELLEMSE